MNTYVPIFRGLDARGGRKLRTDTHTNTRDNYSNPRCAHARRGLMMMNVIRKCCFYRSLFCNFSRADDHWEGILALKCAAPCLQVYLEVEPSDSQSVEKAVKVLY